MGIPKRADSASRHGPGQIIWANLRRLMVWFWADSQTYVISVQELYSIRYCCCVSISWQMKMLLQC